MRLPFGWRLTLSRGPSLATEHKYDVRRAILLLTKAIMDKTEALNKLTSSVTANTVATQTVVASIAANTAALTGALNPAPAPDAPTP